MKRIVAGILALSLIPLPGLAQEVEPTHQLILNEVMAGSEVNPDKDHWFELYNPGEEEIMLYGWQVRGVTIGGMWIDLVEEDYRAIQPHDYFLVSHYTNSRSSALAVRPQVNKTSIQFPAEPLAIELKDPSGQLADRAWIDRPEVETDFRSYERAWPIGDGTLPESWARASTQVNLKEGLVSTYATPFAPNLGAELPPPPPAPEPELLPRILINEVLPNPKKRDYENEFIELLNAGDASVDLRGWELDDENGDDDTSYFFIDEARDYALDPGEFLVLYSSETLISLNDLGDGVQLFDGQGNLINGYFYAPDLVGRSWGRNSENLDEWLSFNHPTPGAPNIEVNHPPEAQIRLQQDSHGMKVNVTGEDTSDPDGDVLTFLWEYEAGVTEVRENPTQYTYSTPGLKIITLTVTDEFGLPATTTMDFEAKTESSSVPTRRAYPNVFLINEFMVNPAGRDEEGEWIELYNSTGETLNLSSWYLDDVEGGSRSFQIPENTYLESGAYLVFHAPELGLALNNDGDEVRLLDPNKEVKQTAPYTDVPENSSYAWDEGRQVFEWTDLPTPGTANTFPEPPKSYSAGVIKFESVLPNPEFRDEGQETITLRNDSDEPIDLKDWSLSNAKGQQVILDSFTLAAGQSQTFDQSFFKLNLKNSEDHLVLLDPAGNGIDRIEWSNAPEGYSVLNVRDLVDGVSAMVNRVIDGDTIVVELQGALLTLRLIGVNTPETVHPFKAVEFYGKQASDYLKNRLTGQSVTLAFEPKKLDKYGRFLAYVYLDGTFVNAELVAQGYGYAYTRFQFQYLADFVALETQAKTQGLGLWQNEVVRRLVDSGTLDPIQEEVEPAQAQESEPEEIPAASPAETAMDCTSAFFKIDAISPAPKKGEGSEFIRLTNVGTDPICFQGWSLDDDLDKGSKPFAIPGGSIAPGGARTFWQRETRLKLNNQNDCASLIDPTGQLVDQICYGKTHKNEIFTHAGGNWRPQRSTKRATSKIRTPVPQIAPLAMAAVSFASVQRPAEFAAVSPFAKQPLQEPERPMALQSLPSTPVAKEAPLPLVLAGRSLLVLAAFYVLKKLMRGCRF